MRFWLNVAFGTAVLLATSAQEHANVSPAQNTSSSMTLTPSKIDFGTQPVGVASQPKSSTLTNTSNTRLEINDITVSGIDFAETSTCPEQLSPGSNCVINVTFKPAINEPRFGTVIISDSGPGSPHMLLLSGVGQ